MHRREAMDLVLSWVTISVAFAFAFSRLSLIGFLRSHQLPIVDFLEIFPSALVVTGTGFVLHELAHKYVAIHFGNHAEFRAWSNGLVFAVVTSLVTGWVFAAPGATYVFGENIDEKKNALISLAGPLLNIIVGLLFLIAWFSIGENSVFSATLQLGVGVNFFLALFNMLPIYILDGRKVFDWNKAVWAIVFVPLLLVFLYF